MSEHRAAHDLREASAGWREMGRHLEDVVRGLDNGVARARGTHWQGPSAEAFGEDWTRLRKTVDDALPVFELAAADLDSAAERAEQAPHRDESADTPAPDHRNAQGAGATGYNVAYALTALSQISMMLGQTFGRGRGGKGGGGRRGGSQLNRAVPVAPSAAPQSADPFGPPEQHVPAKEMPRGGLGIARGLRGPVKGPDGEELAPAKASTTGGPGTVESPDPRSATAGADRKPDEATAPRPGADSGSSRSEGNAPSAAARSTASTSQTAAQPEGGSEGGSDKEQQRKPDAGRHGAFG